MKTMFVQFPHDGMNNQQIIEHTIELLKECNIDKNLIKLACLELLKPSFTFLELTGDHGYGFSISRNKSHIKVAVC